MRWRVLIVVGRWQLMASRCPHCGWPKLAIVRDGIMRELPNASRQPEPASGDRLDADVGLRIVWRGDAPGTITAVEPRGAGGPLVSVRLDDGSEMHGLTVGEWAPEANASLELAECSDDTLRGVVGTLNQKGGVK